MAARGRGVFGMESFQSSLQQPALLEHARLEQSRRTAPLVLAAVVPGALLVGGSPRESSQHVGKLVLLP